MNPIDRDATPATVALYRSLQALQGTKVLFGHQDDLACGTGWAAEAGRSDVKEVTGAHPAVHGFDLGHVELGAEQNLDGVRFEDIRRHVREAYAMGALVTLSWHADDPVTGGTAWTELESVPHLLPGGSHAEQLAVALDRVADFLASLTDDDGAPIPVVFRPYHEHTGDWFWWGTHNRPEDVAGLWRHTVEHLRDHRGLHHLLWAYSPDRSRIRLEAFAEDYLWGYPGDDYVDVLGLDDYWDLGHEQNPQPLEQQHADLITSLTEVARLAAERDKLAALTEVGVVRDGPDPWSGYLLTALTANEGTRRHVWALTWRNPAEETEPAFTPAPGSPTAPDLVRFARDPFVVLADELPDLYRT
jgi:mannan endo-1,4-beta-mannosidase